MLLSLWFSTPGTKVGSVQFGIRPASDIHHPSLEKMKKPRIGGAFQMTKKDSLSVFGNDGNKAPSS